MKDDRVLDSGHVFEYPVEPPPAYFSGTQTPEENPLIDGDDAEDAFPLKSGSASRNRPESGVQGLS